MSKQTLLEKLTDKSYRDAFISDEIDIGLPMKLRAMREAREWNQGYVAERTETKQPRFSLMEKPGYGKYSLSTLKKLASLFDVGLIVSFVPYSEMIDFTEAFNRRRLAICGFAEEYPRLAKRYARTSAPIQDTLQPSLDFSVGTNPGRVYQEHIVAAPFLSTSHTPVANVVEIPVDNSYIHTEIGGNTNAGAIGKAATAA